MGKDRRRAEPFGRQSVGDFLDFWLAMQGMTQAELAKAVGIKTPNFVSMIATGRSKLPIARVPAVADALGVSRTYLMRLVLGQDHPELLAVMEEVFGHMVSANEFSIIQYIREVSDYTDPGLGSERVRELLAAAFRRPKYGSIE